MAECLQMHKSAVPYEEFTGGSSAAMMMFLAACTELSAVEVEQVWSAVTSITPTDGIWHSLKNCVAYQVRLWNTIDRAGTVLQPGAFRLALVLRHTQVEQALALVSRLLKNNPNKKDLTSYIASLLTDSEASGAADSPAGPAPALDLQLFADCELAVLGGSTSEYKLHAKLVRAEYAHLSQGHYRDLRVKILNKFCKLPKLFHTRQFEHLEQDARENIQSEIKALK